MILKFPFQSGGSWCSRWLEIQKPEIEKLWVLEGQLLNTIRDCRV